MFKLSCNIRESRGFSSIELIVVAGIILVGAMAGYSLLANVYGTRAANIDVLEAQQDARNIVERIARELRESSPEVVMLGGEGEKTQYITFFTPRDADRKFMINTEGSPAWQRTIGYRLDWYEHKVYRYQMYLKQDPDIYYDSHSFEVVAKNVEELSFARDNDLITISVRTFSDSDGKMGSAAPSYANFQTTVKMRN